MDSLALQKSLIQDPCLQSLLSPTYNPITFISQISSPSTVSQLLPTLTNLKQELVTSADSKLHSSFSDIKSDLELISSCDGENEGMAEKVKDLVKLQNTLEMKFLKDFHEMETQMIILRNSAEAQELAEEALSFLQSMKILKTMGKDSSLLSKSTEHFYIIQRILNNGKINGLEFVSAELELLDSFRKGVTEKATASLHTSLLSKSLPSLHSSLQFLFNLHCLDSSLQTYANTTLKSCSNEMKGLLALGVKDGEEFVQKYRKTLQFFGEACERIYILSFSLDFLESHSLKKFGEILKSKGILSLFDIFWEKLWKTIFLQSLAKLSENRVGKFENLWKIFISHLPVEIHFLNGIFEQLHLSLIPYYFPEGLEIFSRVYDVYEELEPFIKEYCEGLEHQSSHNLSTLVKSLQNFNGSNKSIEDSRLMAISSFLFLIKNNSQTIFFFKITLESFEKFAESLNQSCNNILESRNELPCIFQVFTTILVFSKEVVNAFLEHSMIDEIDENRIKKLISLSRFEDNEILRKSEEIYLSGFFEGCYNYICRVFVAHKAFKEEISFPNICFEEFSDFLANVNPRQYRLLEYSPKLRKLFESHLSLVVQLFTFFLISLPKSHHEIGSLEFEFLQSSIERISIRGGKGDLTELCLRLYKLILLDISSLEYLIEQDPSFSASVGNWLIILALHKSINSIVPQETETSFQSVLTKFFQNFTNIGFTEFTNMISNGISTEVIEEVAKNEITRRIYEKLVK